MIDPHIHVLPGIDDGARTIEDSRNMLDIAQRLGMTTLIATPHLTGTPTAAYLDQRRAAMDEIAPFAVASGITIIAGFENLLAPTTAQSLTDGVPLALGNSNAVLVELSLAGWPAFADHLFYEIQQAGFVPILAHPERYPLIRDEPAHAYALRQRGVVLQVTTSAFAGVFGRDIQKTAETLLLNDAVHMVGSDAHGAGRRFEFVTAGVERIQELVGEERTHQLTSENMQALLDGRPLPAPAPIEAVSKKRWRFPGWQR